VSTKEVFCKIQLFVTYYTPHLPVNNLELTFGYFCISCRTIMIAGSLSSSIQNKSSYCKEEKSYLHHWNKSASSLCVLCIVVVVLCEMLSSYVYLLYYVCVCALQFFTIDAGLLARSQYLERPATGHLDTGFSWFPCVYKQMLRWFPRFQVATTCFSCIPPDLNLVVINFIFYIHLK